MLEYTGHPFVDVGIATITAFARKRDPTQLTEADLDSIAAYMKENYVVNPLKSFLTVAFPNSGFTQPAYNRTPEKRTVYADRVLGAYRADAPRLDTPDVFMGKPASGIPLDVKGELPLGKTYRQHIPLLTGEGVMNFFPYGDAGLPVSGEALLALQALPLGCAKSQGRLLAVHSDDPEITFRFAREFLRHNLKAIQLARDAGEKKLPEAPHRTATLFIETLIRLEGAQVQAQKANVPASVSAYHFSNSGQGADLEIYHLPMEVLDFIRSAIATNYRETWNKLVQRGWEITKARRSRKGKPAITPEPRYNVFYEDLLRLPDNARSFIRTYFLRIPRRHARKGDPRSGYSLRGDIDLVSWNMLDLFLRKVVHMDRERIEQIRRLGDTLAEYVNRENDRRFFRQFLTEGRYAYLRMALIKASTAQVRQGRPPLITFDQFIAIFEEGEDLPYRDWSLARDLVLIRMIEQLYDLGWLQEHKDALPEELPETETS